MWSYAYLADKKTCILLLDTWNYLTRLCLEILLPLFGNDITDKMTEKTRRKGRVITTPCNFEPNNLSNEAIYASMYGKTVWFDFVVFICMTHITCLNNWLWFFLSVFSGSSSLKVFRTVSRFTWILCLVFNLPHIER